ncbi:hypothetical protein Emed_001643 [Eimeria media]
MKKVKFKKRLLLLGPVALDPKGGPPASRVAPPTHRKHEGVGFSLQLEDLRYASLEHWEERYKKDPDPFDWFNKYAALKPILLDAGLQESSNILMLGCGTSMSMGKSHLSLAELH